MDNQYEITMRFPLRHVGGGEIRTEIWERRVWMVMAATESDAHEKARKAAQHTGGSIDAIREV